MKLLGAVRFFALACFLFLPLHAGAESPSNAPTQSEVAKLQAQISAMQSDISEIKESVAVIRKAFDQAREKSAPVQKFSVKLDKSSEDDFALGRPDAPITIMEFFDFQCGFCAKFNKTTFRQIRKEYIDTGKVRFVFRDFTLSMHEMAAQAASLATCAQKQGKYLEMHEALFNNPQLLGEAKFDQIARMISGLDPGKFEECLQRPEYTVEMTDEGPQPSPEVQADMKEAERLGVMGTPAFFIGKTVGPGEEMSGVSVRGDQDYSVFENAISQALK